MAKGKATSSEDKARVIEAKINNPDLSTRDIEEKTGVNYATTSRILNKDLQQVVTKSDLIAQRIDTNCNLITLCDIELIRKLQEKPEELKAHELINIKDSSFKQNEIMGMTGDEKKELVVKFEI